MERVHVERQVVQLTPVIGDRAVGKPVEAAETVDVRPHRIIIGVENMGAIAVNGDPLHRLGVGIACHMAALIHNETAPARIGHFPGEYRSEQTRAYDQVVVLPAHSFSFPSKNR